MKTCSKKSEGQILAVPGIVLIEVLLEVLDQVLLQTDINEEKVKLSKHVIVSFNMLSLISRHLVMKRTKRWCFLDFLAAVFLLEPGASI